MTVRHKEFHLFHIFHDLAELFGLESKKQAANGHFPSLGRALDGAKGRFQKSYGIIEICPDSDALQTSRLDGAMTTPFGFRNRPDDDSH